MADVEEVLKELRLVREKLERIEALLEERLIGVEEPLPDEIVEIEGYEEEKRSGKLELVELEDVLKRMKS